MTGDKGLSETLLAALGTLGLLLPALETLLDRSWTALGLLLGRSSATLELFLALLAALWLLFGRSWAALGPLLGALGPIFAILGRSWGVLGLSWAALGRT